MMLCGTFLSIHIAKTSFPLRIYHLEIWCSLILNQVYPLAGMSFYLLSTPISYFYLYPRAISLLLLCICLHVVDTLSQGIVVMYVCVCVICF